MKEMTEIYIHFPQWRSPFSVISVISLGLIIILERG